MHYNLRLGQHILTQNLGWHLCIEFVPEFFCSYLLFLSLDENFFFWLEKMSSEIQKVVETNKAANATLNQLNSQVMKGILCVNFLKLN